MRRTLALALLTVLAGCGTSTSGSSAPSASPSVTPSVTAVTFAAADGVTAIGKLHGAGTTAVVLSNMGDNDPSAWEGFAPNLTARGYTVLTFEYRYPARTPSFTAAMARGAVDDLRGAIAFVRARGADRVVLIGASLGGMATAKVAGSESVNAAVIIAAPADLPEFGLRVQEAELRQMTGPSLFIASVDDPTVPVAETRRLFDAAPEPKQWRTFASAAHGTLLLRTSVADEFRGLLVEFVTRVTPA